jgi:hypothetical protein
MRSAVAVLLLVLPVGACGWHPIQEHPHIVRKIDRLRVDRDNCLLAQAAQLDDGRSDIRRLAREVALSCSAETAKMLEATVPYADAHARDGFQDEAARRAADIVVSLRKADTRVDERPPGNPTPLTR